jgi:hypothetical protein
MLQATKSHCSPVGHFLDWAGHWRANGFLAADKRHLLEFLRSQRKRSLRGFRCTLLKRLDRLIIGYYLEQQTSLDATKQYNCIHVFRLRRFVLDSMRKLNGRWSRSRSRNSSGVEHAIKRGRDLLNSAGSAAAGSSGRGLVARRHDNSELVGFASWFYERKPSTKSESEFDSSVKFALVVLLAKAPKCGRRAVCSLFYSVAILQITELGTVTTTITATITARNRNP